jgi:hypothetical protein
LITNPDDRLFERIFNANAAGFLALAQKTFAFQYAHNHLFAKYANHVMPGRGLPLSLEAFPFLPISFFKQHRVAAFEGEAELVFTSSSTTGVGQSRHFVKSAALYEQSFRRGFEHAYGVLGHSSALLCLLPAYLERQGSSLVYMANALIQASGQPDSGFFLSAKGRLAAVLAQREQAGLSSVLLGVTFALLDFAEWQAMPLQHTVVMETGGMKGRQIELTRAEVHQRLKASFGVADIHAEYGMTELLSQAYAKKDGLFRCPPWLKALVRSQDDPLQVQASGTGILCFIDLANYYSCAFIETADLGRVHADGCFEVLGRMDNSDVRGCSLLAL